MHEFTALIAALEEAITQADKLDALAGYFAAAPPADAAWALFFLSGRRLPPAVPPRLLREWAAEEADVPPWLVAECHGVVGDVAETLALLVDRRPQTADSSTANSIENGGRRSAIGGRERSEQSGGQRSAVSGRLHVWLEARLLPLRAAAEDAQRAAVLAAWRELKAQGRFVWNRLLSGSLRAGVPLPLLARALARVGGAEPSLVAQRLQAEWQPTPAFYTALLAANTGKADAGRPFPFCLPTPLEGPPDALGPIEEWQAEWLWGGLRAQLVRHQDQTALWSQHDELLTPRFPEIAAAGAALPAGTVLDGVILPWRDGAPLPKDLLAARTGRKRSSQQRLDAAPAAFMAFDLLQLAGDDTRHLPLDERRRQLEALLHAQREQGDDAAAASTFPILHSASIPAVSWEALSDTWAGARERGAEGLVLKRRDAPYRAGREGDWYAWNVAPHSVSAVLLYAGRGSGARANLYSEYTFGLWHDGALVPFAKTGDGLTDSEVRKVDAFVRRNTLERFGPVRTVRPELVFEVAFEGVARSPRHKSGLAVRAPRIIRRRPATLAAEADTLDMILSLLPPE